MKKLIFCLLLLISARGFGDAAFVGRTNGNATADRYYNIDGLSSAETAESERTHLVSTDATLKKLYIWAGVAPGAGKSWTVTVRKNAGDTSLAATISDSATSATDTTDVDIAPTDEIDIHVASSGGPDAGPLYWCVDYEPDTSDECLLSGNGNVNLLGTSTRYFSPKADVPAILTSAGKRICIIPFDATIKKLYVELTTAPGAGATRKFWVRKNGVDQTLAVTIADTATTGNDTSNTVDITAGDYIEITSTIEAGTPDDTYIVVGLVILPDTAGLWPLIWSNYTPPAVDATNYVPVSSQGNPTATEADAYQKVRAITAKALYSRTDGDPPGAGTSYTMTLRDTVGGDSELSCVIADTDVACNDSAVGVDYSEGSTLTSKIVPANTPASQPIHISCAVEHQSEAGAAIPIFYNYYQRRRK